MEVSHFELIWKKQAPVPPAGGTLSTVLQGYFLEITNLEAIELQFAVEFVAATVTPGNAATRSLAGNTLVFVDVPNVDSAPGVLNGSATSTVFTPSTGSLVIPPKATALIAVLPSAFNTGFDTTPLPSLASLGPTNAFEVRGYVNLRLPTVRRSNGPLFGFREAQTAGPVKVLLTPQNRAVYYGPTGAIEGQTQATLPTASGTSLNMVPPDQPFIFTEPVLRPGKLVLIKENIPKLIDQLQLGTEEGLDVTIAALASLSPDQIDLKELNVALKKLDIGLAVERRDLKK
jgi:hypothetical protein